eukprot:TRINITY_DN2241_c0_g1_i1.p1 TRINITY_DN2241_c0_g1~~TRINITY_DN2241_c0_g1_i1.p1  ORF type:complete len:365 (-),score=73.20 TRINITY_DN2241_c0_g1_i1:371-1465(-)
MEYPQYILYFVPLGLFRQQLSVVQHLDWKQHGWGPNHEYFPHCSLSGFFPPCPLRSQTKIDLVAFEAELKTALHLVCRMNECVDASDPSRQNRSMLMPLSPESTLHQSLSSQEKSMESESPMNAELLSDQVGSSDRMQGNVPPSSVSPMVCMKLEEKKQGGMRLMLSSHELFLCKFAQSMQSYLLEKAPDVCFRLKDHMHITLSSSAPSSVAPGVDEWPSERRAASKIPSCWDRWAFDIYCKEDPTTWRLVSRRLYGRQDLASSSADFHLWIDDLFDGFTPLSLQTRAKLANLVLDQFPTQRDPGDEVGDNQDDIQMQRLPFSNPNLEWLKMYSDCEGKSKLEFDHCPEPLDVGGLHPSKTAGH